ncbi:IDEAL domain-containing protein [Alkalibacillus haloalkaliphilus]|uniref:IDEAL domain-containing protein n=1 Tax=Alkalibacillus haloalkaliphilus TaxID=94136 RepID=UPI0029365108|nr:IDEAL domain-containing protein [Alkalibacillus haloalkaliphilus]MDV2582498.1 IDEAL domain-containing protein [Alkalibacillus haloalkaliphilus]
MKNQVTSYVLIRYQFPKTIAIKARREIPYEFKLASRLLLDEMVFEFNKHRLEEQINDAIDQQDIEQFNALSKQYAKYVK